MILAITGKAIRLKHFKAAGIVMHWDLLGGENMADSGRLLADWVLDDQSIL